MEAVKTVSNCFYTARLAGVRFVQREWIMGLNQALWTGLTGMKSHQTWTTVIGNNLANVSTTGFKRSDVSFTDVFYGTLTGATGATGTRGSINAKQGGLGTTVSSVTPVFTQGDMDSTGRTFDLGIEGNGLFAVSDYQNRQLYYTRNGNFYLGTPDDTTHTQPLLTADGLYVQGYNADATGKVGDTLGNIVLPEIGYLQDGQASENVVVKGNLNSNVKVSDSNSITTAATSTSGTGWMSDTGGAINVGGVQTSKTLVDSTGAEVGADTDLLNLGFVRSGVSQPLFAAVPTDYTVNSRQLDIEYKKGGMTYTATFTYGEDGTTLEDLCDWMCGGLGDNGTTSTERLDGGALGTIRTRAYTEELDGFDAPSEQAGAYLARDTAGDMTLSIASNLGSVNYLSNMIFSSVTNMTSPEGETTNAQAYYRDLFAENPKYEAGSNGGNYATGYEVYTADATVEGGVVEENRNIKWVKLAQDDGGTVWRWYVDGGTYENDMNNQGTGVVRFDSVLKSGQTQVLYSNTEGNTALTFDFSQLTQANSSTSVTGVADGFPSGELQEFTVDVNGIIYGVYSNGQVDTLAQVALANFPNDSGLTSVGNTLFQQSEASGDAEYFRSDSTNLMSGVRTQYLESSNVNMAQEMSRLLLSQRGYQVSSRLVTTADEMLQEVSNMKR